MTLSLVINALEFSNLKRWSYGLLAASTLGGVTALFSITSGTNPLVALLALATAIGTGLGLWSFVSMPSWDSQRGAALVAGGLTIFGLLVTKVFGAFLLFFGITSVPGIFSIPGGLALLLGGLMLAFAIQQSGLFYRSMHGLLFAATILGAIIGFFGPLQALSTAFFYAGLAAVGYGFVQYTSSKAISGQPQSY